MNLFPFVHVYSSLQAKDILGICMVPRLDPYSYVPKTVNVMTNSIYVQCWKQPWFQSPPVIILDIDSICQYGQKRNLSPLWLMNLLSKTRSEEKLLTFLLFLYLHQQGLTSLPIYKLESFILQASFISMFMGWKGTTISQSYAVLQ